MISAYKSPNFGFVASQLRSGQIEAALQTSFYLGALAAAERAEDTTDAPDGSPLIAAIRGEVPSLDEEIVTFFRLGETV